MWYEWLRGRLQQGRKYIQSRRFLHFQNDVWVTYTVLLAFSFRSSNNPLELPMSLAFSRCFLLQAVVKKQKQLLLSGSFGNVVKCFVINADNIFLKWEYVQYVHVHVVSLPEKTCTCLYIHTQCVCRCVCNIERWWLFITAYFLVCVFEYLCVHT